MVDTAYQGPEGRSEGLRPVIPPITAYTERVRLSLAVGDAAEPPVGETVASNLDAATAARALIGREITECMAAEVIGVSLLDHVIVSATRSYSFAAVEGWS